jgi:hypothetical protein
VNKRERVGGDLFSPSLSSLPLLCFESLFSRVLGLQAFFSCTVPSLTDNSGSRVSLNGSNQLASRVPKEEMAKGKRLKKSQKEPPQENPSAQQSSQVTGSVQTLPPKRKKEKTSSAHAALPIQPVHPFLIRSAPSSSGTSFTILQRSSPKDETKKKQKDEQKGDKGKEETSSQSSQETEIDATLPGKKGKKKNVQAKLDTSP